MRPGLVILGGFVLGAMLAKSKRGEAAVRLPVDPYDCRWDDFPEQVPPTVQEGYAALRPYVGLIERLVGPVEITSWWRPPQCNSRVGGAEASRHLEGWAVDMRLRDDQSERLGRQIARVGGGAKGWGDYVRREIGTSRKVGFRMYPSGNIHIDLGCPEVSALCRPRSSDWLDLA